MTDYLLIFLPMILGYGTSLFCSPTSNSGSIVRFTPPGWVFGIVWPILYLMIGIAWSNSKQQMSLFVILMLLLNGWLLIYGCLKQRILALYTIFLAIMCTLYIIVSVKLESKYLMIPLFMWLNFAGLISAFEIQYAP